MTTYGVDRSGGSTGSATVPALDSIHWNDVVFLDSADSPYTVTNDDRGKLLAVDASGGAVTINLPSIAALPNFPDQTWILGVKKTDGSANAVTINRNGTDTIDDVTAKSLTATDSGITLVPDTDTSPDQWVAMEWGPTGGNWTLDSFSGTGAQTAFTLSADPGTENNTFVFIDGVYQAKSEYSVSGTTLTFSTAPASGTNNVQVMIGTTLAIGVPGDGTVTTAKIVDSNVTTAKIADSNVTTAKIADDAVTEAKLAFSPFRRNVIINGSMQFWQRNPQSSYTSIADGTYFADRWKYAKVGAVVHDISRSSDVPTVAESGTLFTISTLIDVTTADAAIAAGDLCVISQFVEGYNWLLLAQRACVLTFWVKATKTGTYCVALQNSGQDRSYVAEYTINTTETWEKKTIQFSASPSTGTWDYTNGVGARLYFVLSAGSNFQGTGGSWQSSNILATANQVNGTDSTSNNFRITGVQLEEGSVATPFERLPIAAEVELCQRYYEKSYNLGINPGTVTGDGVELFRNYGGAQDAFYTLNYKTRKRANANTLQLFSSATGSSGVWRDTSTGTDRAASVQNNGESQITINIANMSANGVGQGHWTVDAEL